MKKSEKDAESTKECYALIRSIKDAEFLKRIGDLAYNTKRGLERKQADKIGWFVDQEVILKPKHQRTRPYNEVGVVIKVNSVKLKVKFPSYDGNWNIPKTMLNAML